MHVAVYNGNRENTLLKQGNLYQIEYRYVPNLAEVKKPVHVVVYPIEKLDDEWWEGHVEYTSLAHAFDEWLAVGIHWREDIP